MGLIDDRYAFPGLTPRALFFRRFAAVESGLGSTLRGGEMASCFAGLRRLNGGRVPRLRGEMRVVLPAAETELCSSF